jgi:hypothetical protein
MRTTFLNGDSEFKQKGLSYMRSRAENFENYMKFGTDSEDIDEDDEDNKEAVEFFYNTGSFFDYGLSFDFVSIDTFDDMDEAYYRFQLGWGGPSDEVRFYEDGTIEYVYMDWGTGVGFDVSLENWAMWLKDWFEGCCSIDWASIPVEEKVKFEYDEDEE